MAGNPYGGYVVTEIGGSRMKTVEITETKLKEVAVILGIDPLWMKKKPQSIYVFRGPEGIGRINGAKAKAKANAKAKGKGSRGGRGGGDGRST